MSNFIEKVIYILIFVGCLGYQLSSQYHPDTDSLFTEIKAENNDSIKIRLYHKIAWINHFNDLELSRICTDSAMVLAEKIDNRFFIGKSYHYYGLYYRFTGNADSAISNFEKATETWGTEVDSFTMSGTIFNLGVMNSDAGNYETAIRYFLDYKRINKKNEHQIGVCEADNSIGLVFKRMKDYGKAISYLKTSYECAQEIDDTYLLGLTLANLQSIYTVLDSFNLSIKYGKLGLIQQEKLQNSATSGMIYDNLGVSYLSLNQLDSAKVFAEKALASLRSQGEKIHFAEACATMGSIQLKLDQPLLAIDYFDQALEITRSGNYKPVEIRIYQGLAEAHRKLGNFEKSFDYLNDYVTISDSIFNQEKFEIISDLEVNYETSQKELQLKNQELEIQKQTGRKRIFTLSSILLGLLAVFGFFFMKNKISATKKIAEQDSQLQVQKINQLEKEKKILAMHSMIEGQEAERIRIAKDLHDGLGGLLSTVKARLTNINAEVKKIESYNIYEKTTSMVDEACDEVRRISHNLLPGALRLDGLKTAIEQLGEDLSKSHPFKVNVETIRFKSKLDETKEIFLYRIVQEATNNIIKHAIAKKVLIQLSETDNEYHIIIEDDGVGFDTTTESKGLGLKSIRSRVEHLQGELDINSTMGEGTTITMHIPK